MNRRHLRLIAVFTAFILLCSFYNGFRAGAQHVNIVYVSVVRVHDGDTISVILNGKREKVRLIGIDAPELDQRPWGSKAKKHLEKLMGIANWIVSLEFDAERRDKYGRLLCYVLTSDKKMINLQMLEEGYAMLFTVPPNVKYIDKLRKAQYEARQQRLGIWGSEGLKESPGDYRRKHPRL